MPAFQGKGIMKEALSEVIRYGFETLKVRRLVGWVHHENTRSISLLSKFNFIRDVDEEEKADKTELGNMVIYTYERYKLLWIESRHIKNSTEGSWNIVIVQFSQKNNFLTGKFGYLLVYRF